MNTRKSHVSNFGAFSPACESDCDGYIRYHDSGRYHNATDAQLSIWSRSGSPLVRRAVAVEEACRGIAEWQSR